MQSFQPTPLLAALPVALPTRWWQAGLDAQQAASRWTDFDWARFPVIHVQPDGLEPWLQSLLDLASPDRLMRFGHAASDEQIRRYVASIDLERDVVLAVFDRAFTLVAGAHVAFTSAPNTGLEAEFGVHVAPSARRLGLGRRLFHEAQLVARNRGASAIQVHSLVGNAPMQRIVQQSAATTTRDGTETSSRLALDEPNVVTQWDEVLARCAARHAARHAADWESAMKSGLAWLPQSVAQPLRALSRPTRTLNPFSVLSPRSS